MFPTRVCTPDSKTTFTSCIKEVSTTIPYPRNKLVLLSNKFVIFASFFCILNLQTAPKDEKMKKIAIIP